MGHTQHRQAWQSEQELQLEGRKTRAIGITATASQLRHLSREMI